MKTFPLTELLTDRSMYLLEPLSETEAGNEHPFVVVDRLSKLTRVIPLQRADAESISAAFFDHWGAANGPTTTVLTDSGPQFRSAFLQGVCSLLGVTNRYYTMHHSQTSGKVES